MSRRACALVLLALVGGCHLIFPYQRSEPPDGPAPVDGRAIPPFGQGRWTFGAEVEPVAVSSSGWDSDPTLTGDGLTLYVSSSGPSGMGMDVFRATRPDRTRPFAARESVSDLNSPGGESFAVSADGRVGLLMADRPGGKGLVDIWIAVHGAAGPWAIDQFKSSSVNGALNDYDGRVSPGGLELLFAPRLSATIQTIHRASWDPSRQDFVAPAQAVEGLVAPGESSADPALSPDGRVLVFTRAVLRDGGAPDRQLWYAVRKDPVTFGDPARLRLPWSCESPCVEQDGFISADGTELFFASNHDSADYDIFRVEIKAGP